MQRVLVLAIALLALVGLRNWSESAVEETADGQVAHRLLSVGWGLPGGLRARPEGLGVVWIGRQWLLPEDRAHGLRVAATTLTGEVIDFFNYDLTQAQALREFRLHCRERGVGTVLSLVLRGSMRNPDPALRALLAATLSELGARAAPVDLETASWALVVRRMRKGWECLGEAYSPVRGVVLTVPLVERDEPIDLIDRKAGRVVSWIARQMGEFDSQRVRMAWGLTHATCDALRWATHASAATRPGSTQGSDLPFELELELGRDARFECTVVLPAIQRTGQADFVLRVDGTEAGRHELRGSSNQVSDFWRVDLGQYAGQHVTLQLSVEASGVPWAAAATPIVLFD